MAGLTLKAAPTFKATVKIPQPGGGSIDIPCFFKHRTKTQLADFFTVKEGDARKDADDVMAMVDGWELPGVPFDRDTVESLLEDHHAAARTFAETYITELTQARAKN